MCTRRIRLAHPVQEGDPQSHILIVWAEKVRQLLGLQSSSPDPDHRLRQDVMCLHPKFLQVTGDAGRPGGTLTFSMVEASRAEPVQAAKRIVLQDERKSARVPAPQAFSRAQQIRPGRWPVERRFRTADEEM